MNNVLSLLFKRNHLDVVFVVLLMFIPLTTFGAGGGGGGGGEGGSFGSGPSISINGNTVAVDSGLFSSDNISNMSNIDGIWSGTFSGISVSYNKSSGQWEGNESHDGGSSLGTNIPCINCGTSSGGYVVSQTCVNNSQVDVTFRGPATGGALYGQNGRDYLGSFSNGEIKSIRLSAGTSYPNAFWFYSYWDGDHTRNQEDHFSFTVRSDCAPPPPTVDLTANPTQVNYKETSTLTWTSQNTVGSCVATGGWSGNKVANNMIGETTQPLTAATTFYLTCSGQTGTTPARDQQTVQVIYGEGGDIKVNDDDKATVYKDDEVKISWDVGTSAPENCVIKAGEIVIKTLNSDEGIGDLIRSVIGETVFTLDCEDGNNIDSASVKVLPEFQET